MLSKLLKRICPSSNTAESSYQRCNVEEMSKLMETNEFAILDIRDAQSFSQGHIPDAINMDKTQLSDFIETTDKSKPVCVYCYKGFSCRNVAQTLADAGFKSVYSMDGGFTAWDETFKDRVNLS